MHLRVQLPARNEARTLEDVVRRTLAALDGLRAETFETSILVIDDGSSDGTREIGLALAREDPRVHVLTLDGGAGLGVVFRAGQRRALADGVDVLVNLDADGQFEPGDVVTVARPVLAGRADLVTGSRFLGVAPSPPMPFVRVAGNRALSLWVSWLAGRPIADVCCGLRAFSRRALTTMELREDFTYTQETLLSCAWAGLCLDEVAVPVRGVRAVGRSRVARSVVRYGVRVTGILARAWLRRRAQCRMVRQAREAAGLLEDHHPL